LRSRKNMGQLSDSQRALLGKKLIEFAMSEGQTAGAQKGCASGIGCLGLLFLGGSIAGIIQAAEWPTVLLNLGIFAVIALLFFGMLRFFKWSRQRVTNARLAFYERGFVQERPSGYRRIQSETCLWSEIVEVARGNIIDDAVLWLKVVKANGEAIRIPNQWLDFPEVVRIIDTRGAILAPALTDEEKERLRNGVNMKGVDHPIESE